ncbi:hypothetical protein MHM97_06320 [Epibacterium sp. Ofav1-8]|nr:hypothetical protein [Epibacterium sp. Ofav1-8]
MDLTPMFSAKPDRYDGSPTADVPVRDRLPYWATLFLVLTSPPVVTFLLPESILARFSGPEYLLDIWKACSVVAVLALSIHTMRDDRFLRVNAWGLHYGRKKGTINALRWADVVSVAYIPKRVLTGYARLRVRAQVPLGARYDLTFKTVSLDPKCSNPADPEVARAQAALDRYWPEWRRGT